MFEDIYSQVWAMESTALRVFSKNFQDKNIWDRLLALIPNSLTAVKPRCESWIINSSELDLQAANDSQAKGRKNGKNYNIRVIPVEGSLTHKSSWYDDYFGIMSTEKIGSYIDEANASGEVDGILLVFNTNGGVVAGTELLANKIKNSAKPVVGFVNSKAHSAGYWLASQCSQIYMCESTSMCGSIGTMSYHINNKGYYEQMGVEINYVTSDGSEDKNSPNDMQALDEKGLAMMKAILNPLNEVFLSAIKSNRPKIDESALTGKIYSANEAIELGMVDGVCSFGEALLQVAKLVQKSEKSTTTMEKKGEGENETITWFQSKFDEFEKEKSGLQAALKAANESIAKLEAEKLTLQTEANQAATLRVELDAANKALQQEGGVPKTVVETGGDLGGVKERKKTLIEQKLAASKGEESTEVNHILKFSKEV